MWTCVYIYAHPHMYVDCHIYTTYTFLSCTAWKSQSRTYIRTLTTPSTTCWCQLCVTGACIDTRTTLATAPTPFSSPCACSVCVTRHCVFML